MPLLSVRLALKKGNGSWDMTEKLGEKYV